MSIKKTTETVAEELLLKHNLTLIGEYTGAHSNIVFLCHNGHQNQAVATNVIQRGYKCKECKYGRPILPKIVWSEVELGELKLLISKGMGTEDIAKQFKTTESAINNACAKYEISNSKTIRTDIRLEEALKLQNRTVVARPDSDRVITRCSNGHVTTQLQYNILYKNTGCPDCWNLETVSNSEKQVRAFIEANYSGWKIYNDRTLLDGKELDIVLPDLGLAIEFNGTYWHREEKVGKTYHLDKTNLVESFDYQLIHIYDYYWNTRQDVVKSRLLSKLRKLSKIPARKTTVKTVDGYTAKQFFEHNHIQGGCQSSYNIGLYYCGDLVACMSFAKPRWNQNFDFELTRYANRLNTSVVGGAGKLFKHRPAGSIISYADRSWSNGNLYKQLGFTLEGVTPPGYSYYKRGTRLSRYQCQKHRLPALLEKYDDSLTEKQNMELNGFYPVYDSGNLIYTKVN